MKLRTTSQSRLDDPVSERIRLVEISNFRWKSELLLFRLLRTYTARPDCNFRVGHTEVGQISEYKRDSDHVYVNR